MAAINLSNSEEEFPLSTSGEPTDQLAPEEDGFEDDSEADFDDEPMDDDDDLDKDEVKRLFPGEDSYSENDLDDEEEPYEGIRSGDEEDEGLVDDNMSGMPVIPSPS